MIFTEQTPPIFTAGGSPVAEWPCQGDGAQSFSGAVVPAAPRGRQLREPAAAQRDLSVSEPARVRPSVERFDRRGTEPFEPFEFFQNRNFP